LSDLTKTWDSAYIGSVKTIGI